MPRRGDFIPIEERFWLYVKKGKPNECWLWTGAHGRYGMISTMKFRPNSKKHFYTSSHRLSYEIEHGPIPNGFLVHHICNNTLCVNPSHLELRTPKTHTIENNSIQGKNYRKSYCKRGHPFDETNTVIDAHGYRQCRICNKIRRKVQNSKKIQMDSILSSP